MTSSRAPRTSEMPMTCVNASWTCPVLCSGSSCQPRSASMVAASGNASARKVIGASVPHQLHGPGATTGPHRGAGGHCRRRGLWGDDASRDSTSAVHPVASTRPVQTTCCLRRTSGTRPRRRLRRRSPSRPSCRRACSWSTVLDPRPRRGTGRVRWRSESACPRRSAEVAARARRSGADATFLVWDGDPAESILAAAEAESADLIVVGSHRRSPSGAQSWAASRTRSSAPHRVRCSWSRRPTPTAEHPGEGGDQSS